VPNVRLGILELLGPILLVLIGAYGDLQRFRLVAPRSLTATFVQYREWKECARTQADQQGVASQETSQELT